jgi:drug/metabolite transporter (DMT)-like permease
MVLGICLGLAAGATTALSMVMQRGILNYTVDPDGCIPVRLCNHYWGRFGKNKLWVGSLVVYGIGTGALYSVAGLYIALALLSCLFITLLVFNLYFSHHFLNEELTRHKVVGSLVVVGGACLCAVGAAVNLDEQPGVEFDSDEIAALYANPWGAIWLGFLVTTSTASASAASASTASTAPASTCTSSTLLRLHRFHHLHHLH